VTARKKKYSKRRLTRPPSPMDVVRAREGHGPLAGRIPMERLVPNAKAGAGTKSTAAATEKGGVKKAAKTTKGGDAA